MSDVIRMVAAALNLVLLSLPLMLGPVPFYQALAHPAVWLFLLLATAFLLSESFASGLADPRGLSQSPAQQPALPYFTGLTVLLLFWSLLFQFVFQIDAWSPWGLLGVPVVIAGIGLRVMAIRALKEHFISHVSLHRQHRLIRQGLYQWLRHPSESGLLMICLGLSLLLVSPVGLLLSLVLMLPLSLYRIIQEERLLAARFPVAFAEYRQQTPALLPGVF